MATFEITIDDEKIQELLHGDRGMAALLEPILNQILQAEMTDHLGHLDGLRRAWRAHRRPARLPQRKLSAPTDDACRQARAGGGSQQDLKKTGHSYPDQTENPIQRPTARWVFQSFVGIHVLQAGLQRLVLNPKEHHWTVSSVLGPSYEQLYASPPRGRKVGANTYLRIKNLSHIYTPLLC